jgi:uncharacterized protein (DUF342 family)
LLQKQQELEKETQALKDIFTVEATSKVSALKIIYPGVSISIGAAVYNVNDEMLEVEFVYRQGEIKLIAL